MASKRMQELKRLERVVRLLDEAFTVPGTEFRFGIDPIIGLVPGAGDTLTAVFSLWIVYRARRLDAPKGTLLAMAGNVAIDWLVGSVPLLGDLFDFGWKANRRNLELLRRHLAREAAEEGPFGEA